MSKEHKVQLEQIRLRLRHASGVTAVDPSVIPSWERLGVPGSSVRQVRLILLEFAKMVVASIKQQIVPPESTDYPQALSELQRLSTALAKAPTDELPRIVSTLLRLTVGPGSAAMTCSLQDAGLEVVPRNAVAALRLLGQEDRPQLSDVVVLRSGWGPDWRLFADLSLLELGYPPLDPCDWAEGLWSAPGLVDPALSPVHRWVAFRRAISLVKAGRLDDAREQVQKFGVPSQATSPVEMEVVNLRAYLLLVMSVEKQESRELAEAIALLDTISQSPIAERNLRLLRNREVTRPRDRPRIENPYLVLGVDHQDPDWKNEWRSVQTSPVADINEKADANRARYRILAFERNLPGTLGDLYALPLDRQFTARGTGEGTARYAPFRAENEALEAADPEAIGGLKVAAFTGLLHFIEQEQEELRSGE